MHATRLSTAGQKPVRRLVVAPFDNLITTAHAGGAVTAALINELRRRGSFDVVEVEPPRPGLSERWTAAQVAKEMKADAVLVGLVTAFDYEHAAGRGPRATPSIGVDLRLVAAASGDVLWAAGLEAKLSQVLSYDSVPLEELAQEVAESVADALAPLQAGS